MVQRYFPLLSSLKNYCLEVFRKDVIAGLTVGIILIPQSLAYALLAGLPPIYGLYGALIPILIYAFLGSSNHLSIGPVAITAILMLNSVSKIAEPFSTEYILLIIELGVYTGLFQILLSMLRVGKLTKYIPKTVFSAFIQAAAILIIISQFKNAFGLDIPTQGSNFNPIYYVFENHEKTNSWSFSFFIVSLSSLLIFRKMVKDFPIALLIIIIGTSLTYFLKLNIFGLPIIGKVPEGIPVLIFPKFSTTTFFQLFPSILTVSFIGFIGSIGLVKSFENLQEKKVNPNKELFALGMAKFIGGFFQAMPSTGSFSRTAINVIGGSKTQVSSLISVLLIIITLLYITPLFYFLPKAILAAIIVQSVFSLFNFGYVIVLWEKDKFEFIVFLITFLTTIFTRLEFGILFGLLAHYFVIYFKKQVYEYR